MGITIEADTFGRMKSYGKTKDVFCFTIFNGIIKVQLITYGATITSLLVPDNSGVTEDLVLGFDNLESYLNHTHYFGSTVGRCANRIANAQFSLNGKTYNLNANDGKNHLHGGLKGFDKVIWDSEIVKNKVVFTYTSPSMEENYPGNLKCRTSYELTEQNELIIEYEATTDRETPVNLTNHSYFNLAGHGKGTIHDHVISINADAYTPVDENLIPTGEITSVESTSFDLRQPKTLAPLFDELKDGFDHNFCVNGELNEERRVARAHHPGSGRVLEIFSTQPGVQFYTGNCLPLDDSLVGKEGRVYRQHGAFCLETQNYPNAINQPNFPNVILDANGHYKQTTRLVFSTETVH